MSDEPRHFSICRPGRYNPLNTLILGETAVIAIDFDAVLLYDEPVNFSLRQAGAYKITIGTPDPDVIYIRTQGRGLQLRLSTGQTHILEPITFYSSMQTASWTYTTVPTHPLDTRINLPTPSNSITVSLSSYQDEETETNETP